MAQKNLKQTTIRSLFWKLFEQGGTAVVTLVVQVVLSRLLGPSEFGMMTIMLVFVNIGNVIVQSGLNTAIIQALDATERDYSTVFWMSLALSLIFYCGVFLCAPFIADFYTMPQAIWPLRVLVLVLIINAYNSIQEAIVARELDFKKTARATIIAGFISGSMGISLALGGAGVWALVIQQLMQQLCKCIVLAFEVTWKPQLIFEAHRALVLFDFGWKLLVSGILEQGYQSLSDLIVGKVFSKVDLGYLSQGKKYPLAVGALLDGAIQPVMLSASSRVQDNVREVKRLARRALKTSTFLIIPSMTLFAVAATPVVRFLLGETWLPSVPFVRIYCIIFAMLPIHTTNLQVLNGMGRSDLFLKLEIIKKIIGVSILCFTAFVTRNLYAIVGGYVVAAVLCTFINAAPNKRVIGYAYSEQIRDILPAVLLSMIAAAAAYPVCFLSLPDIVTIVLQGAIMVTVYLLVAYVCQVEELTYLLVTVREIMQTRRAS